MLEWIEGCSASTDHKTYKMSIETPENPIKTGRMRLSKDISKLTAGWEYEPDELQVRIIAGEDRRDKIQMRIDLGLIQMEISGRPDGTRPEGFDSLLDAFESKTLAAEKAKVDFSLDTNDCAELMREGLQYYHRYLSAFHLQRFDLVVRDTERNLRLFAFVVRYATRQRDKLQFDHYRPYVTMMRSKAAANQALSKNNYADSLAAVDEGIDGIRTFLREYDRAGNEAECMELGLLLRLRREIEAERPVGPVERLEQQLNLAVALEEYEEAARLRDQLQRLEGPEAAAKS